MKLSRALPLALALLAPVAAITVDIEDFESIQSGLNLLVKGMLDYYNGNNTGGTPGMFVTPYYWWEAGVAWNSLLDWAYLTDNHTYDDLLMSSMQFQTGRNWDYLPDNQTTTEGNDDQGFWGILAMTAAEKNFTNPSAGNPGWLYLAQAVFNTMAARWQTGNCNGGLRWQIYPWNAGYNYKNSVSNGCLFNLAARLYRFTGNTTYLDWAEQSWNWLESVKFLDNKFGDDVLSVFDGADLAVNCSDVSPLEFTYNSGLMMSGSAVLYNQTNNTMWLDRAGMLWNRAQVFFNSTSQVMYEAACQPGNVCNTDERCFKGIFAKFLALTMTVAPSMQADIMPYVKSSALAAARSCSGGTDGHTCGLNWFFPGWDGVFGLGEQICAIDIMNALLINRKPGPLTANSGGSSQGDGAAGTNSTFNPLQPVALTITTKDRAGAGALTGVVVCVLLASTFWMLK